VLRVDNSILTSFGKELLVAYGTKPEVAEEVVEHLIENSLRGVEGHGVNRYPEYAAQLEKGTIKGNVEATVLEIEPGVYKVDGGGGFGITAMNKATMAIKNSLKNRAIAVASVTGVGHTGRIGAYTENLASNYVFALVFGGGGHKKFKSTAPFGGRRGVMGTNPVAFALPGRGDIPVSADFSTSSTAGGKLRLARTTGAQLPANQIIDANGRPTNSPEDYFAGGAILPSAGSKGYGLGVICEMLGYALLGQPHEFNWIILALRLNAFTKPEAYASRANDFLSVISNCPPMQGFDAVRYPGEIEMVRRSQNLTMGIPIHENVVEAIVAAARSRGLQIPGKLVSKR
jgi:LDH2 family malate/lactate/ureidoglycolate dehydrogenase